MRSASAIRRERERAQLRESILAAARAILEREGHEAISIRAVAEAIEYAPATLYVHFTDKEAILGELGRRGFDQLAGYLREVSHPDCIEHLIQLNHAYLRFAIQNPRLYELMFIAKGLRFFDPQSPEMTTGPECYQILVAAVQAGQAQGRIQKDHSIPILTYSIWGTVHGMASFIVSQRFLWIPPDQVHDLYDTVARAVVDGLTSRP